MSKSKKYSNKNTYNRKNKKSNKLIVTFLIIIIGVLGIVFSLEKTGYGEQQKVVNYIVKEGDTIESIAKKYQPEGQTLDSMIVRIQVVNNINEIIYPEQVIKIPLDSEWINQWEKDREKILNNYNDG